MELPDSLNARPVEMVVLRARRLSVTLDDALTQTTLLRYLSSGVHAGRTKVDGIDSVDAWTDGYWVWDDRDIELVRQTDCVPSDEEFTLLVLASATAPALCTDA